MGRIKDLTGQRFGRLTVLRYDEELSREKGRTFWVCKCDCGNEISIRKDRLSGNTQSCGCLHKEHARKTVFKDMIGKRFGRLTVIKEDGINSSREIKWLCKCDCGNEIVVRGSSLRNKTTQSCGCLQKDKTKEMLKEKWQDEEFRQRISETNKEMMINKWKDEEYREAHSGENNPSYNFNLTEEDRSRTRHIDGYKEWNYKVKEEANFTCDICSIRGCKLHSHHLESYNSNKELRTELSNGVCLCDKCHKEFHHIYGYGNNTKEQYIEFKENKNKGEM